jgi:uncharacterized protein
METKRLLVAGAVGAGKTTFVQAIGELGAICTEEIATDETANLKPTTTVALDFSRIALPTGILHVYGAPGQSRFSFMWELLLQRSHLLLLLVAAHRPEDFAKAQHILTFMQQRSPIPTIIGLTHMDSPDASPASAILSSLGYTDREPLYVTVNPLDRSSVLNVLAIITAEPCIC